MLEEKAFPLIILEQTEQYRAELKIKEAEKDTLERIWKEKYGGDCYVGNIITGEDGEFIFFINEFGSSHTGRYYGEKRNWPLEEAIQNALKYGAGGWATVEELELLIKGKGPLLIRAMRECGFQLSKNDSSQWVRINESQQQQLNSETINEKLAQEELEKWPVVPSIDIERLKSLWVMLNESAGLNRTYTIQANREGFIYISLQVNPFSGFSAEQLSWFGEMSRKKGHIAKHQNGFNIMAKNLTIEGEKGVYIQVTRCSCLYIECIWPHLVPEEKLYSLAKSLIPPAIEY